MGSQFPQGPIPRTSYYLLSFINWLLLSSVVGIMVGVTAALFNHTLKFVTEFRIAHGWMLWLLPIAGLAIIFLYRKSNVPEPRGTDLVIEAVRAEEHIPAKMAPLIFVSTALTHLFGGSAGREGAALQLGGSMGQLIADVCIPDESKRRVLVMCGMSAAFSALFGTPIAATVFSLELASIGVMYYSALVPCTISSIIAVEISKLSGIRAETFFLENCNISVSSVVHVIILSVLCAGISVVFCKTLHASGHIAKRYIKNQYIRIFSGGCIIIAMVYIFGSRDYLGAGMNIIERAIEGEALPWAFALKLLFTAVTIGCGYKGGEIVPTLFVGATFGCFAAGLIGLSPSLGAALGMISLFCGVTNCPITALLLAFELFGFSSPVLFMLTVAISYMLSGYYGLYGSQKIILSKTQPVEVFRTAH